MIEVFPMLCQPSKGIAPTPEAALKNLSNGQWYFDLKWDGIRCMAHIENGVVTLINRDMRDITFRYPEIVATLSDAFPTGYRVFDGEVVCFINGQPDFPATHRRDAQQSATAAARLVATSPASLVAFDYLINEGDDLRAMPYRARQLLLNRINNAIFKVYPDTLKLSAGDMDGEVLWDFVCNNNLEGLIAKRLTSRYTPGRSHSWIKLKVTRSASCIVSGYDYGKSDGALRHTVGALHLRLLDNDGAPVGVGKVGTGLSLADRAMLKERLDRGDVIIVEVQYQEVGSGGQLRTPSFKGIRMDVDLLDCTLAQIE